MELRPPPAAPPPPARRGALYLLLIANLALVALLAAGFWLRPAAPAAVADPERRRELAARLQAAGALDEAAEQWERYLASVARPPAERARIAYSLGVTLLEAGRYERALRWFYEAESLGAGELGGELEAELDRRIVHTLERLGRHHAAEAAMGARVALAAGEEKEAGPADPVVARIGADELRRSRIERALDAAPGLARLWADPAQRPEVLRQVVAEELLWRKARKLELDDDPEVRRRHAELLRRLAVSELVERELLAEIELGENDLRSFHAAHGERYRGEGGEPRPFAEVRPLVERDLRLVKLEEATQRLIDGELAAAGVELFPERLDGTP